MNATQISDDRVNEIIAALNSHYDTHKTHDSWVCGCNPFEDIIYALDEYDGPATEDRFRVEEYAFVLTDGTVIQERAHDGRWEATNRG